MEFCCELLGKQHNRSDFRCGVAELDGWFQQRARQDHERGAATVSVLVPMDEPTRIAGFYSLCSTSVVLSDLPTQFARKLPRYPAVPATLLGRLARDLEFPGVVKKLLFNALKRAWENSLGIASTVLVVDAKDDRACDFYRHHGFQPLVANPRRLFLPLRTVPTILQP